MKRARGIGYAAAFTLGASAGGLGVAQIGGNNSARPAKYDQQSAPVEVVHVYAGKGHPILADVDLPEHGKWTLIISKGTRHGHPRRILVVGGNSIVQRPLPGFDYGPFSGGVGAPFDIRVQPKP